VASTPWNEKEKVLKFVELTCLYPSLRGATWRMDVGVGAECLWATWLSGEALGQHDRQQENIRDVKQELLSCMRPLLLTYAAITPPWATQSFTTYIMAYLCQLATPLWSENLRRVGWRDTSNRPDERGGQEHQPGGKNIVSELVEAVRCAKSLG
jgi:hypothetical protein